MVKFKVPAFNGDECVDFRDCSNDENEALKELVVNNLADNLRNRKEEEIKNERVDDASQS